MNQILGDSYMSNKVVTMNAKRIAFVEAAREILGLRSLVPGLKSPVGCFTYLMTVAKSAK